jgi:hypothetical protein
VTKYFFVRQAQELKVFTRGDDGVDYLLGTMLLTNGSDAEFLVANLKIALKKQGRLEESP